MLKRLFLALLLSLLWLQNSNAATEFISKICASGANCTDEDYNSLSTWENVMDDSDGSVDLTGTAFKCGNWDGQSGSNIADHASVTWDSGASTGQLMHMTNRTGSAQYYLEVTGGSLANDDVVSDGTNSFTVNGAPDSCIITAEIFADDGNITGAFTVDGFTTSSTNYVKITANADDRHAGVNATSGKSKLTHTQTGSYQKLATLSDNYTILENLIIAGTSLTYDTGYVVVGTASASNITVRNNVIFHTNPGTCDSVNPPVAVEIYDPSSTVNRIYNNIAYDFTCGGASANPAFNTGTYAEFFNNTCQNAEKCFVGGGSSSGVWGILKNNIARTCSTHCYDGYWKNDNSSTNNITDEKYVGSDVYAQGFAYYRSAETTTGAATGKLIDSTADFVTAGVKVGSIVYNDTAGLYTYVTARDSAIQLSVADDIMTDNDDYYIYKVFYAETAFSNAASDDFHLASTDRAVDYGVDLGTSYNVQYDIDGVARSGTWDIGADEYVAAAPAGERRVMIFSKKPTAEFYPEQELSIPQEVNKFRRGNYWTYITINEKEIINLVSLDLMGERIAWMN